MTALTRRQMMIGTGVGGLAIGALLTVPALGFVLSPLSSRRRSSGWIQVGSVELVQVGKPKAIKVGVPTGESFDDTPVERIVYVVRKENGQVRALTNVCTHMQCDVHWDESLTQFLCPCHGGIYDLDGNNVSGPPPSPLPQWVHKIERNELGERILYITNEYDERI